MFIQQQRMDTAKEYNGWIQILDTMNKYTKWVQEEQMNNSQQNVHSTTT